MNKFVNRVSTKSLILAYVAVNELTMHAVDISLNHVELIVLPSSRVQNIYGMSPNTIVIGIIKALHWSSLTNTLSSIKNDILII